MFTPDQYLLQDKHNIYTSHSVNDDYQSLQDIAPDMPTNT